MKRLEVLLDAIASVNGFKDPESQAYQCRNPLGLKEFRDGICQNKLRRFPSLLGGYGAALYDLKVKCSGESRAKLDEQFDLRGLVRVYSMPDQSVIYIARFLRKALRDETIRENTSLKYFVEV